MRKQLSVDANLDLTVDGHPIAIRGEGQRLTVAVDEAGTAWRLFQANRPGRHLVRTITDTLEQFGIDIEVSVGGRSVLEAGPSVQAGRIAAAVGLPQIKVTPPVEATVVAAGLAFLAGIALGARR